VNAARIRPDGVFFTKDGRATDEGRVLIATVNELWRRLGGVTGQATVANLGDAIAPAMKLCTDETGGAVMVFSDGTDWRRVTDRAVAS
jgi:hypothetical protein